QVSAILGEGQALLQESSRPLVSSLSHEQPPLRQHQFSPPGQRKLASQLHRGFQPVQSLLCLIVSAPEQKECAAEPLSELRFSLLDGEGKRRSNVVLLPFEEPHGCSPPCSTEQVWLGVLHQCKIILGMTPLHAHH